MRAISYVICVCLICLVCFPVHAERRIALLVGNEDYDESVGALNNPVNDLRLVRETLLKVGFASEDIVLVENADRRTMLWEMEQFIQRSASLTSSDLAFFYYSGHGAKRPGTEALQLIPVDAVNAADTRFWFDTVSFDNDFVGRLEAAGTQASLVISIDACRNEFNLPVRALGSGDKGFGVIPSSAGMLISFAADNNQTARDYIENDGIRSLNSPYALAMSEELLKPGRSVSTAFGAIRPNVLIRTSQIQQPVVMNKLNRDPVLLASVAPTPGPSTDNEEAEWNQLSAIGKSGLEVYLSLYPNGNYAEEARLRLSKIVPDENLALPPIPEPKPELVSGRVFQDRLKTGAKGPDMIVVPSGTFLMGSPASEIGRLDREGPVRTVNLRKPFAVGKFEITWSDWEKCVSARGCDNAGPFSAGGDEGFGKGNRPVINVSWNDAKAYVKWLSAQTGFNYRLLTEAEWEYAARAGTTDRFSNNGDVSQLCLIANHMDDSVDYAWRNTACSDGYGKTTSPVGAFAANAFGLHDMHGNVWEWVEDCWNTSYSGAPATGTASGTGNCSLRVLRGGSWYNDPLYLRSANRNFNPADSRQHYYGFRVARDIDG